MDIKKGIYMIVGLALVNIIIMKYHESRRAAANTLAAIEKVQEETSDSSLLVQQHQR